MGLSELFPLRNPALGNLHYGKYTIKNYIGWPDKRKLKRIQLKISTFISQIVKTKPKNSPHIVFFNFRLKSAVAYKTQYGSIPRFFS